MILIFIEDLFRDEEVIYPYYRFIEAGYVVKILGPQAGKVYTGKLGVPMESDLSPEMADLDKVEAIIIPGGFAPDRMRLDRAMVDLLRKVFDACKVIAAICHGGWMLVEADICRDKDVTGFIAIATDLKNAGGRFVDKEVVVDGNIVTSRKPSDLPAFCRSVLELLKAYK